MPTSQTLKTATWAPTLSESSSVSDYSIGIAAPAIPEDTCVSCCSGLGRNRPRFQGGVLEELCGALVC
jgi:hypothetical protein